MTASTTKPNLLLVFSDQHRWSDLPSSGNKQVIAPHLEQFARESIVLNSCISNSPLCVPSRGTMFTGLYALKHGAASNDLPIRHDEVEGIAKVLQKNGYHTGLVGKWHLAGVPRDAAIPAGNARLGFEEWKVANCTHAYMDSYYDDEDGIRTKIDGYEPIVQTDLAVDFIQRNQGERPWFLTLAWGPPHDPYDAVPQSYKDLFAATDIQYRPNVPEQILVNQSVSVPRSTVGDWLRGYYAHIAALDEQFGRLLQTLERTGQADNTIVVYTSDHGDMLGSQGFINKQLPYEESCRVPLIVRWPGHTLIGSRDELIALVDLPVSLLGLAGFSFSSEVDGADYHQLFVEPAGSIGAEACYLYDLIPCHQAAARNGIAWRGIRTSTHMFARGIDDQGFLLYDLIRDPYQLNNLVRDPASQTVKSALLEQLDIWIAKHDALLPWEQLIVDNNLTAEWNRSQAYFGLPLLDEAAQMRSIE